MRWTLAISAVLLAALASEPRAAWGQLSSGGRSSLGSGSSGLGSFGSSSLGSFGSSSGSGLGGMGMGSGMGTGLGMGSSGFGNMSSGMGSFGSSMGMSSMGSGYGGQSFVGVNQQQLTGRGFVGAAQANSTGMGTGMTGLGGTSGLGMPGMQGLGSGMSGLGNNSSMYPNDSGQYPNGQGNMRSSGSTAIRTVWTVGFTNSPPLSPQLNSAVTKRLAGLPGIHWRSQNQVEVRGRTAILRGVVATEHDRDLAERVVCLEAAVDQVDNQLMVAGSAKPVKPSAGSPATAAGAAGRPAASR